MRSLIPRVERLEAQAPDTVWGKPFLWFSSQPLAQALEAAGLTLEDKPLFAIRIVGVPPGGEPAECPLYERDKHLLD